MNSTDTVDTVEIIIENTIEEVAEESTGRYRNY